MSRVVISTVIGFLFFLTQTRAFEEELSLQMYILQEAGTTNFINVMMGEPVRLRIQLTNQGKHAFRLIPSLDPSAGCISLHLVNLDGSHEYLSVGRWEVRDMYIKERELSPNQALTYDTFLYGKLVGVKKHVYLFPEQGNYGLYARFIGVANQSALTSTVVQITVGAPVPKWEELQEAGIVRAIEGRSSSDMEQITRQEQLLQIMAGISDHPLLPWIMLAQQQLQAQVTLKPEALNVSPGILTAFVRLPAGYAVSNITSAICDGAPCERMMPNEDGTEMIIKFRRQDIEAALAQIGENIDTNFVVRGTWQGAAGTNLFQGADSITKIVGTNLSRSGRE